MNPHILCQNEHPHRVMASSLRKYLHSSPHAYQLEARLCRPCLIRGRWCQTAGDSHCVGSTAKAGAARSYHATRLERGSRRAFLTSVSVRELPRLSGVGEFSRSWQRAGRSAKRYYAETAPGHRCSPE